MSYLTHFALVQWRLTVALMALVIFGGVVTYQHQPSQEDPEITIRTAVVSAQFPGLPARRVEQLLAKPIEEAVRQIPEVKTVESASQTGIATVKVSLWANVQDVKKVWTDLRNKVTDLSPTLPDGTIGPFVNDDYGRVAVTTLAVYGDDFSQAELRTVARWLRDRLTALPLVSRIDLYGIQQERVWLEFDRIQLAREGLSVDAVLRTIADQNRILPSGALETEEGMRYTLSTSGNIHDWEAIADIPVATASGAIVYVRDVLRVIRGYVDPVDDPVLYNGLPAVTLGIAMVRDGAIQAFGASLEARLAELRDSLPAGMSLDIVTHQPPIVAASVVDATHNLIQTIATVLAVVILFLGVRAGTIVGAIVPLTIFMSLVGMLLWGIPLHRISIAAIIIALGLLVDNGVVIAEDIARRLDQGANGRDAALEASRTLAVPLLTSSLTTILAFLPLMLAEDTTGEFLRALSQVLIITLLSSWILSVTVTPLLCATFLRAAGSRITTRTNRLSAMSLRATELYGRALGQILSRRWLFLSATAVFFGVALLALARIPTGLLPPSERAQFVVNLEIPAGSSETETARIALRFARFLADRNVNPEIVGSVIYVGSGGPRFFLALSPADPAPHVAFGVVNTATPADVAPLRARVERFLTEHLPEGRGWTELLFLGSEPPGTVQIRLKGEDIDTLYQAGQQVLTAFAAIPGTRDLRTDWANPVLHLHVLIDQERARRAGVAPDAAARALQASFEGAAITDYREGDNIIPVVLRAGAADRATLDDLSDVRVVTSSGTPVPLLQFAKLGGELQPWIVRRHDQERAITVSAVNPAMQASQLLSEVTPALDALGLPRDIRWEVDGEVRASKEANAALFQYLPHCLAGIVLILIWQFNSFRRPLIILATIPLVMIGVSLGLNVMGGLLDFNAMLGIFSLAGIIVNNGIVLIERIDEDRRQGMRPQSAIVSGCMARLRPIVMTTLTTILGLVPLHLFGGALWHAMTIVMMFGLGVGTILTLGFVPALYAVLFIQDDQERPAPIPSAASLA